MVSPKVLTNLSSKTPRQRSRQLIRLVKTQTRRLMLRLRLPLQLQQDNLSMMLPMSVRLTSSSKHQFSLMALNWPRLRARKVSRRPLPSQQTLLLSMPLTRKLRKLLRRTLLRLPSKERTQTTSSLVLNPPLSSTNLSSLATPLCLRCPKCPRLFL